MTEKSKKNLKILNEALLKAGKAARLLSDASNKMKFVEENSDWDMMIICDLENVQIKLSEFLGKLIEYNYDAELCEDNKIDSETGQYVDLKDNIDSL